MTLIIFFLISHGDVYSVGRDKIFEIIHLTSSSTSIFKIGLGISLVRRLFFDKNKINYLNEKLERQRFIRNYCVSHFIVDQVKRNSEKKKNKDINFMIQFR